MLEESPDWSFSKVYQATLLESFLSQTLVCCTHSLLEYAKPFSTRAALLTFFTVLSSEHLLALWGSPVLRSISYPVASLCFFHADHDNILVLLLIFPQSLVV